MSGGVRHGIRSGHYLEAEAGRDEGTSTGLPKAEPPRDVTDGLACGLAPPDGAEDLRDDSLDARRRAGSKREPDFGGRRCAALPALPYVVIDLRAEAPMSRQRLLLGLTCPPVRAICDRVRVGGVGLGPAHAAGQGPRHGSPFASDRATRRIGRSDHATPPILAVEAKARGGPAWPERGAVSERGNRCAAITACLSEGLVDIRGPVIRSLTGQ